MLVEHRPSHLRHTTDQTAASLRSSLRPTAARRHGHADTEAPASGRLTTSDLAALYPAIFAEESTRRALRAPRIAQFARFAAVAAQFALSAIWYIRR